MKMKNLSFLLILPITILLSCQSNQVKIEETEIEKQALKITADDPDDYAYFGKSVALTYDGSTIIVGAMADDAKAAAAGAAYILNWDGSNMTQNKITASDGERNDHFGFSVAISSNGQVLVVGAPDDDDMGVDAGCIYIYQWNETEWKEKKLSASDGEEMDRFGESLAISGDGKTIVVGAPREDESGISAGAIYIYRKTGISWLEAKITPMGGKRDDNFGQSVDITYSGNRVLVGAPGDDIIGQDAGTLYIYDLTGDSWEENQIIRDIDSTNDRFGESVAISDDGLTLAAGAVGSDVHSPDGGSVCFFEYKWNEWSETILPMQNSLLSNAKLGFSLDCSSDGTGIIAGTDIQSIINTNYAKVYLWYQSGLTKQMVKINQPNVIEGTRYGNTVAISGDGKIAIIGTYDDVDENILGAGSIHLIKMD